MRGIRAEDNGSRKTLNKLINGNRNLGCRNRSKKTRFGEEPRKGKDYFRKHSFV